LSPRSPRRHVCITKYNCGKDAVDSEKIHAIATASPPSELQSSLLPATDLLDPAAFNPSLAEYYTNHALALDHLTNKCIDYDMTGSVFMPESFCFETGEYGGPLHNLIRESDLYSVDHVMNWQAFFNEYIASADPAEK
jgi:hypothetical protein